MSIEANWSAYFKDDPDIEPFAHDLASILPTWLGDERHGPEAAQWIAEAFFNDAMWTATFETEDTHATICVEIHAPAQIAGRYRVELERRTKATAQRLLPVMRATG